MSHSMLERWRKRNEASFFLGCHVGLWHWYFNSKKFEVSLFLSMFFLVVVFVFMLLLAFDVIFFFTSIKIISVIFPFPGKLVYFMILSTNFALKQLTTLNFSGISTVETRK
ncbi:hypothetical protein RIF29_41940 [Crotalaria pallida]|uniref:Uncharacterized protein n=1 Tax=Crotalaria pallida TaxID=3830 RepID=A0AAN9HRZ5_CROPI